jgi:hypothetical protein
MHGMLFHGGRILAVRSWLILAPGFELAFFLSCDRSLATMRETTLVFELFDDIMDNLLSGEIATTLRDLLTCFMWVCATGPERFAFVDYAPATPRRVRP